MGSVLTIIERNNQGAWTLATAERDSEAINILKHALPLLVDLYNATSKAESDSSQTKVQAGIVNDHLENESHFVSGLLSCFSAVAPVKCSPGTTAPIDQVSLVYQYPLIFTNTSLWTCDKKRVALASAIVIYNLALAFHRCALTLTGDHEFRTLSVHRAKTLYTQAIGLIIPDVHLGRESTALALIVYNNLAQIYADILFDHESAEKSLVGMSQAMRFVCTCNQMLVLDVNNTSISFFSKRDWEGFLSNLYILHTMASRSAAAA